MHREKEVCLARDSGGWKVQTAWQMFGKDPLGCVTTQQRSRKENGHMPNGCVCEQGRDQERLSSFCNSPFVSEFTQTFENYINPFGVWFSHYLIISLGITNYYIGDMLPTHEALEAAQTLCRPR